MSNPLPHAQFKEILSGLAARVGDGVLLIDLAQRHIHYCNPAAESLALRLNPSASDMPCSWLLAQVHDDAFDDTRDIGYWTGSLMLSGEGGDAAIEVSLYAAAMTDAAPLMPAFVVLRDTSTEFRRARELQHQHDELSQAYRQLATAQQTAVQNEKMASTGRLAAGVAHEINNPIGYVHSNLGTLQEYANNLVNLVAEYDRVLRKLPAAHEEMREIDGLRARCDIDFALQDIPQLLGESLEGIGRVRKIVQDLKDFSHPASSSTWALADLHKCIDSTLNIASSEIKYKAKVEKRYGALPPIECLPSELSQVFMNLLVNAAQAIPEQGTITIATGVQGDEAWVSISDTGPGIQGRHLPHIFEPFFTTKAVGRGTGLGLSISYAIVNKHNGRIEVFTAPEQGASFRVVLPIRQPVDNPSSEAGRSS